MSKPIAILLVDDDEDNRQGLTPSLANAGYEVIEAASSVEAIEKASMHPDLIILGARLAAINGFELCRKFRENPATSHIPILHLSASSTTSDDRAQGLDCGADAYLSLAAAPVEIIATVRALLRTRRVEEELRQSEERYRQIIENLQDFAIFATDLNGVVTTWNIGAQRLLGFHEDEIVGKSAELIYTPDDRAAGVPQREMESALKTGCSPDERWHQRKDGSRLYINGVVNLMRDASGRVTGFSKLMQDQTDRKLAQQELQQSKEAAERAQLAAEQAQLAAEQANRLKDDFLATLSHELRTPLNAIIGWSQLMRASDSSADDFAEGLETIERNAKVQAQLIEDLLDISRIISGKLRLQLELIEVPAVIEAAVDSVTPAAEAKGVRLRTVLDRQPLIVRGDAARLQQVVWNLVSNAIKFTPTGGSIIISALRDADAVELTVSDTGAGINPAFLPYVFDRFRQADATTTRVQAGLGLGLSIVKQLVETHGGYVTASSDGINRGATFSVFLPVAAVNKPISDPAANAISIASEPAVRESKTRTVNRSLAGVKVLIVEDDRDSRLLLKRILADAGATVGIASDVAEALTLFQADRRTPYDVIVSDIGMPIRDGYDLLATIRSKPHDAGGSIPMIALTAFAREEDRTRALRAGFQSHIAKPTDANQLIEAIRALANR